MEYILNPWPWYISGPLITIIMALLLYFGKTFGMSSNLSTMCTILGAGKRVNFFNMNWKDQSWNITVVIGAIIGAGQVVVYWGSILLLASVPVYVWARWQRKKG
jgi:hypothetical protein